MCGSAEPRQTADLAVLLVAPAELPSRLVCDFRHTTVLEKSRVRFTVIGDIVAHNFNQHRTPPPMELN